MAKVEYNAVGRRKNAIARVRLVAGDGKIIVNKRDLDSYFGLETLKMTVRQPLELTKAGGMIANVTYAPLLVYSCVALTYFAMCFPITLYARVLERRLRVGQR